MMKKIPRLPEMAWFMVIGGLILAFVTNLTAGLEADPIKEIRPNDRILILQHAPWAENMTVLDAGPGLVVVDTWSSPGAASRAKAIMEERFHKKAILVINTHHHWDHTFGNQAFAGATIAGHRFCAGDMQREYASLEDRLKALDPGGMQPGTLREFVRRIREETREEFFLTVPDRLVDDRAELKAGDLTIRLYHAPGLHTRGNLTIWVPELNLIFTRREFGAGAVPVLESGVDLPKLVSGFAGIQEAKTPLLWNIPGHGDPQPSPVLDVPLNYLRALGLAVRKAKARGESMAEAGRDPAFTSMPGGPEAMEIHLANLAIVWQEFQPFWKFNP